MANRKKWMISPYKEDIDVVALQVEVTSRFYVESFNESDFIPNNRYISVGDDLLVMGYPLGIYDSMHNAPITRSAIMSSLFHWRFKGKPCFLIDSRLHSGMSGSPVLLKPQIIVRDRHGKSKQVFDKTESFKKYLLGIHSEAFTPTALDPTTGDSPMDLNVAWFASIISKIIENKARPSLNKLTRTKGKNELNAFCLMLDCQCYMRKIPSEKLSF